MPKHKINRKNSKHSILRCFYPLREDLEGLLGVKAIGTGKFQFVKHPDEHRQGCKIMHYDNITHTLYVVAIKNQNKQKLFIRIDPDYLENIARYVNEYSL